LRPGSLQEARRDHSAGLVSLYSKLFFYKKLQRKNALSQSFFFIKKLDSTLFIKVLGIASKQKQQEV
jgi:hypothetical protein